MRLGEHGKWGEKRLPRLYEVEVCSAEVFRHADELASTTSYLPPCRQTGSLRRSAKRLGEAKHEEVEERQENPLEETSDPVNITVARSDGIEDCCFSLGKIHLSFICTASLYAVGEGKRGITLSYYNSRYFIDTD